MKALLTAALLSLFLVVPAAAQDDAVWGPGTDAWIFGLSWQDSTDQGTQFSTNGQWLRYTSDTNAFGVSLSMVKDGPSESGSAGPAWEFNFPQLRKGHFFFRTKAELLAGDAADVALANGVLGVGYKLHVGNSSAVRFTVDYSDTIDDEPNAPAAALDEMSGRTTFGIAIELGVNKATPVR